MISKYIGVAYLALQVVSWFMGRIDKNEQAKLTEQALNALRLKMEDSVIVDARAAYDAAVADAAANPGSVREPDKYSRT